MSVQTRALYDPDPTGSAATNRVLSCTLLEPPGGSVGTEKVSTPIASPPEPRLTPSKPVVDRTVVSSVFTMVAVATIRPRSWRTEIRCTESGKGAAAAPARTARAATPARPPALAIKMEETHAPTATISTRRSRHGARKRANATRLSTDRTAAFVLAPTNKVLRLCKPADRWQTRRWTRGHARTPAAVRSPALARIY
jgi:hypothetical protein